MPAAELYSGPQAHAWTLRVRFGFWCLVFRVQGLGGLDLGVWGVGVMVYSFRFFRGLLRIVLLLHDSKEPIPEIRYKGLYGGSMGFGVHVSGREGFLLVHEKHVWYTTSPTSSKTSAEVQVRAECTSMFKKSAFFKVQLSDRFPPNIKRPHSTLHD